MAKSCTSVSKRGPVLWFCLGVVFTITLAPIMAGALGSLFWSTPSDGPRDDRSAAERLLDLSGALSDDFPIQNSRFILMSRYMTSNCFNLQKRIADLKLNLAEEPIKDLQMDMDTAWGDRLISAVRQGSLLYLTRLPRPLLGSLDSCVAYSVLAPVCGKITRGMLRDRTAEMVRYFNQRKSLADARLEAERCTFMKLATKASRAPN